MIRHGVRLLCFGLLPVFACAQSRDSCLIIIDVGHSRSVTGATSARGVGEYLFNSRIGAALVDSLRKRGFAKADLLVAGGTSLAPGERADLVKSLKPALLLSIHHDSVQPQYLKPWKFNGVRQHYCDRFNGYSLFCSRSGSAYNTSLKIATLLGTSFRRAGFSPSLHHAENIRGERRELVDSTAGIYRFDGLALLKRLPMPAVLVECGVIVNRDEELLLNDPERRGRFVAAVARAVEDAHAAGLLAPPAQPQ